MLRFAVAVAVALLASSIAVQAADGRAYYRLDIGGKLLVASAADPIGVDPDAGIIPPPFSTTPENGVRLTFRDYPGYDLRVVGWDKLPAMSFARLTKNSSGDFLLQFAKKRALRNGQSCGHVMLILPLMGGGPAYNMGDTNLEFINRCGYPGEAVWLAETGVPIPTGPVLVNSLGLIADGDLISPGAINVTAN